MIILRGCVVVIDHGGGPGIQRLEPPRVASDDRRLAPARKHRRQRRPKALPGDDFVEHVHTRHRRENRLRSMLQQAVHPLLQDVSRSIRCPQPAGRCEVPIERITARPQTMPIDPVKRLQVLIVRIRTGSGLVARRVQLDGRGIEQAQECLAMQAVGLAVVLMEQPPVKARAEPESMPHMLDAHGRARHGTAGRIHDIYCDRHGAMGQDAAVDAGDHLRFVDRRQRRSQHLLNAQALLRRQVSLIDRLQTRGRQRDDARVVDKDNEVARGSPGRHPGIAGHRAPRPGRKAFAHAAEDGPWRGRGPQRELHLHRGRGAAAQLQPVGSARQGGDRLHEAKPSPPRAGRVSSAAAGARSPRRPPWRRPPAAGARSSHRAIRQPGARRRKP